MQRLACLLLALLVSGIARAEAASLAIVGGTIIDGNGGPPVRNGVIVIAGERIAAIGGKSTPVPENVQKIDASGRYIIPGLMDANVHLVLDFVPSTLIRYEGRYDELAVEAAQVALKNGLTTVFDSWGPRAYLIKARDAIDAGRVPGSRFYLAGNIIGLGGPFSDDFWGQVLDRKSVPAFEDFAARIDALWQENVGPELTMKTPETVRQEVRRYAGSGVDFLKYAATNHNGNPAQYIHFSPRVQEIIVAEAHRAGIMVQTHTSSVEGLHLAIAAGVDLLQHCETTGPEPIPVETVRLMVERRVPCATFLNTIKAAAWYREQAKSAPFMARYEVIAQNQRALLQAGATLLLATDAGIFGPETLHWSWLKRRYPPEENLVTLGEGHLHWLLAAEQMGMQPMDALLAATRNIAKAYKVDKDLGTLEAGKLADLLILTRDPLQSAANYRSLQLIVKNGSIVQRDLLPTRRWLTSSSAPRH